MNRCDVAKILKFLISISLFAANSAYAMNSSCLIMSELVHSDKSAGKIEGAFFTSNEYDYWREAIDIRPVDLVMGFASNSVWDRAVSRNAKAMIIADRDSVILETQQNYFRPLVALSKTPAEFLSFISGVPISENLKNKPIEEVFDAIDSFKAAVAKSSEKQKEQKSFIEEISKQLAANPKISEAQRNFVMSYHQYLLNPSSTNLPGQKIEGNALFTGNRPIVQAGPIRGRSDQVQDLYAGFRLRYHPRLLREAGAPASTIQNPLFSIVSSQMAFDRLKNIFDGNIYYVHGNAFNPDVYREVKKFADKNSYTQIAVMISNVLDQNTTYVRAVGGENRAPQDEVKSYLRLVASFFPSLTVYQTRGVNSSHEYQSFDLKGYSSVEAAMSRYPDENDSVPFEEHPFEEY